MRRVVGAVVAVTCLAGIVPAAFAQDRGPGERRVALVIGNGNYKSAPLVNPINDARAMALALKAAGFAVIARENAGHRDMVTALRQFGDEISGGAVGLFYYAGHGMQVKGRNFLIPVDADIGREDEVPYAGVDAGQVLDKMEAARNRLNIMILDACRNNPFARSARSGAGGLAQMDAPVGTLIAFATAPGAVASDGTGGNGLYTQHLLAAIRTPGLAVEDVFKRVRANVRRDSNGQQIPWESTSLEGDFFFLPKPPAAPARAEPRAAASVSLGAIERPALKVGDSWKHQVIDLIGGSVKNEYGLRLTEVTPEEWRFGSYVTNKDWNLLRRARSDDHKWDRWTPNRPQYQFPLTVGQSWTTSARRETATIVAELTYTFKVIRQERVIVPAGIFDTLRVEGTHKYKSTRKKDGASGEGTGTTRYWFSPVVGRFVASEFEETNWKGVVYVKERDELLSYTRTTPAK